MSSFPRMGTERCVRSLRRNLLRAFFVTSSESSVFLYADRVSNLDGEECIALLEDLSHFVHLRHLQPTSLELAGARHSVTTAMFTKILGDCLKHMSAGFERLPLGQQDDCARG